MNYVKCLAVFPTSYCYGKSLESIIEIYHKQECFINLCVYTCVNIQDVSVFVALDCTLLSETFPNDAHVPCQFWEKLDILLLTKVFIKSLSPFCDPFLPCKSIQLFLPLML